MAIDVKGGYENMATYACSPMSFVLQNLPKQDRNPKEKHVVSYKKANVIPDVEEEITTVHLTSDYQMKELKEMRKQFPI